MFIEKLTDNNKFEVGGVYSYAFACNSDSYDTIVVLSVSATRKTCTIADYYGDFEKLHDVRKKKITVCNGVETISAGNYSMAGMWHASERSTSQLRKDLDVQFMHDSERADDMNALPEMPEPVDPETVGYTAKVRFCDGDGNYIKVLDRVSLAKIVGYATENAEQLGEILGGGWYIDLDVYENGKYIFDCWTRGSAPADIMQTINYSHPEKYGEILFDCAAEILPADVMDDLADLLEETAERNITMTTTSPDDDPEPPKPTDKPNENITYSAFDNRFNVSEIITVSFGGVKSSAEAPKRKKLTETEWKKQLEMKASFEISEGIAERQAIANKIAVGVELSDGTAITKITEETDYDGAKYLEITLSNGEEWTLDDLTDAIYNGAISFSTNETVAEPDPEQMQLDFIAYSETKPGTIATAPTTSEPSAPAPVATSATSPIDESAARRALESYSFSGYHKGSATDEYNARVLEVQQLAEDVKTRTPEEFHADIDRLVAKYAAKLAAVTNDINRCQTSVPSVMITGPANYPVRKHEKQMSRLRTLYGDLEAVEHIKDRIRGYVNRPIMSGDETAVERLTEKVEKLRAYQEQMKQENAEARKNGTAQPHPTWELSNNRQNLKTAEERLNTLKKAKEAPTAEAENLENKFCKVVRNSEIMRLQLFFNDKPSEEVRNILKSNGFKWAPSQSAWQRQLTHNAEYSFKHYVLPKLSELVQA